MAENFKINHGKRGHSQLSPSGSFKWLNCLANPFMEQNFGGDEPENVFAEEGTLAHEISELFIRNILNKRYVDEEFAFYFNHNNLTEEDINTRLSELRKHKLYRPEIEVEIMPYVNHVCELVGDGCHVELEPEIDLSCVSKDMKGHIDFVLHKPSIGVLHIVDLKFGLGVEVSSEDNSQLLLYAIGYLETKKYGGKDKRTPPQTIVLEIIQPRKSHHSTWVVDYDYLMQYKAYVRNVVELIIKGDVGLAVGEHCRFCKAKTHCPEFISELDEIIFQADINTFDMDEEKMEYYLGLESVVKGFFTSLRTLIQYKLENGVKMDRFKLVEGRSTTKIANEEGLVEMLTVWGELDEDALYQRSLRNLTYFKSLLGANKYKSMVLPFTEKTKGSLKVATIDDKRQGYKTGADLDFEGLGEQDFD